MPKARFPIETPKMRSEAVPGSAGAGGLEVVDQRREVQRRMDRHQQVDVIGLATELEQLAAPLGEDFPQRVTEAFQQRRSEGFAAVFGNQYDMQLETVYRVRRGFYRVSQLCGLSVQLYD